MAAVHRSNTNPELQLRRRLHALGLRYRVDHRIDLPGGRVRPDVAFTRRKVAVFVDGCFWHSCPIHATRPVDNRDFWAEKLTRNADRDREQSALLEGAGWAVVRIWEHESPEEAVRQVLTFVNRPG